MGMRWPGRTHVHVPACDTSVFCPECGVFTDDSTGDRHVHANAARHFYVKHIQSRGMYSARSLQENEPRLKCPS